MKQQQLEGELQAKAVQDKQKESFVQEERNKRMNEIKERSNELITLERQQKRKEFNEHLKQFQHEIQKLHHTEMKTLTLKQEQLNSERQNEQK